MLYTKYGTESYVEFSLQLIRVCSTGASCYMPMLFSFETVSLSLILKSPEKKSNFELPLHIKYFLTSTLKGYFKITKSIETLKRAVNKGFQEERSNPSLSAFL